MHSSKLHRAQAWCVCTFLTLSSAAFGQYESPVALNPQMAATTLEGQIQASDTYDRSYLKVLIVDNSRRVIVAEAQVSVLGTFETSPIPSGIYELRVVNREGDVIRSTGIGIPYQNTLRIDLTNALANAPARPISLSRLQHKIPKKAQKAYFAAKDASEKGDKAKASVELEKAIALDPQFFEAANNLGVMYLTTGRLSEAYEMFQRATTIDSSDPLAEANLAYVLLAMNRFPEAEQAARASVRGDALSGRARFFLAVSLLEQNKGQKEAIFHLTKASAEFDPARKLLAILGHKAKDSQ